MNTIKYAIADDHKIFRQGLRFALSDYPGLKFVGEAENGIRLLELVKKQQPDVVLLDLKMPEMDGIEATEKIHATYPKTKILMLTSYDDQHFILHLVEAGANGYLLKNSEPAEIHKAIKFVCSHDFYFNDLISAAMLKNITRRGAIDDKFKEHETLNEKEIEVLKLVCQEYTATEIGNKLFMSPRSIERIRTQLIEKAGARNTAGLVLYAVRNGLVH